MKVLITGASGRLAEFVIRELAGEHELILTSRRQPSTEFSSFPWVKADLNCFEDCQLAVAGVEAIQHLGAQPEPSDHPELRREKEKQGIPFDATFKTNLLGTYYLLQAAVEARVRIFVMTGSNCAFGHGFRISKTPFPIESLPIEENHPCYPEDSYSFSKGAAEALLASYSRAYGIRTYVTRPAGIRTEAQRRQIAAEASLSQEWDPWLWAWVGSEDLARAHRLLLEAASQLPLHDVYLVNADDTTALEPSRELVQRFRPQLLSLADKLTGHQSFLSCDKIKRLVGWQHQTTWRHYLTDE
ncbi:MAG: NAD(P)-dependent oxidoreductase [Xenococcus sp. MO_188.B8]|nr:NAD(P)-dependent oxidoreductase [Xenococcus sp. MO_188.B8]